MLGHWSYMAMLAFVVAGSWWLEFAFRLKVLRNPRRILGTIAVVVPMFIVWDYYAIAQGHWFFEPNLILGIFGPFGVPLEEYVFFLVVPAAGILTLEGVSAFSVWLKRTILMQPSTK